VKAIVASSRNRSCDNCFPHQSSCKKYAVKVTVRKC